MTARKRTAARLLATLVLLSLPSLALANWTASGRFVYQDRLQDQTGFTGVDPQKSMRFVDVQVVDNAGTKVLAVGATDANGNFSIAVTDNKTRSVYVRALSQSLNTPGLWVDVQNGSNAVYALVTTPTSHNPNTNVNYGTLMAAKGNGGEVFNLYDQEVYAVDYIASLRGSRPPQVDDLTVLWKSNRGVTDSNYISTTRSVSMRDSGGYDDTVVLHEIGHYFVYEYSKTDFPGGSHTFSDCNIDLRLAWDEGYATYFGNSVLRYHGLPNPHLYIRTNGTTGTGGLVRYENLEVDPQWGCQGAASEVDVTQFLWDINDTATTADGLAGDDDNLAEPDSQNWEVLRDYFPGAGVTNRCLEDFWDGWFKAPISNGHLLDMRDISSRLGIVYSEDAFEVNNSTATATALTVGTPVTGTFFYDSDGDGAGEPDTDVYWFSAASGSPYTIQTSNLVSDGNTFLELLDTNGTTVLASNNDRATGDQTSLISWTAPRSDTFFVRVTHAADLGIYGSYNVQVTSP